MTGHAIEARLYAEDPAQDFRPDSGDIALWQPPMGAGIRVDDGIATGQTVSPFYDPMPAKIIACGETRDQARERLIVALRDTVLFGVACNRDFPVAVLRLSQGRGAHVVRLRETGDGVLHVMVAGESHVFTGQGADIRGDGIRADLRAHLYDGVRIYVATGTRLFALSHDRAVARVAQAAGGGDLHAPMHGILAQICVAPGDIVQISSRLAVLEAMKMQQDLLSEVAGTVRVIPMAAGTQVKSGDLLVEISVEDAE